MSKWQLNQMSLFRKSFQNLNASLHYCSPLYSRQSEKFTDKLQNGPDLQHFIRNSNKPIPNPYVMKKGKMENEPYIDSDSLNGKSAKGNFSNFMLLTVELSL